MWREGTSLWAVGFWRLVHLKGYSLLGVAHGTPAEKVYEEMRETQYTNNTRSCWVHGQNGRHGIN